MEYITIELESKLGHVREYECKCQYNPQSIGGNFGNDFEHLPESRSVLRVFRNNRDITNLIKSKKILKEIDDAVNYEFNN